MDKVEFLLALEELTEEELPPLIDWAQQRMEQLKKNRESKIIKEIENLASEIGVEVTLHSLDNKRAKPLPKYKNPDTGVTWSGRGKTPLWLQRYIDEGRNIEEFEVSPNTIDAYPLIYIPCPTTLSEKIHNSIGVLMHPLPPKYENPETGETWSGRGRMPRWLKRFIDEGKSIVEFQLENYERKKIRKKLEKAFYDPSLDEIDES